MTKEIARIKALDLKAAEDKVRRAAVMAAEVEKINSAQVERKRNVAEREILEDAMIAEYVRQRDLREQVSRKAINQMQLSYQIAITLECLCQQDLLEKGAKLLNIRCMVQSD